MIAFLFVYNINAVYVGNLFLAIFIKPRKQNFRNSNSYNHKKKSNWFFKKKILKGMLPSLFQEVAEPLSDLKKGIDQLRNNKTFKCIISVILTIGNFLNGASVSFLLLKFRKWFNWRFKMETKIQFIFWNKTTGWRHCFKQVVDVMQVQIILELICKNFSRYLRCLL